MKKKLLGAILGLAAVAAVFNTGNVAKAQGQIWLDNYNTGITGNYGSVLYGAGSGGTLSAGVSGGFNVGLYMSSSLFAFEGGATTVGGGNNLLSLPGAQASGAGATATIGNPSAGFYFSPGFVVTPAAAGQTVYFMVLAYNGADYNSSLIRGHSSVLQLTAQSAPPIAGVGSLGSAASFHVALVPEPSTFALAGLGLASLLIFRRRK